ncbi:MAG: hypothetical protein EBZ59_10150 [Planctomycetia bacterium]|nr:hypothetical protein [Planctomycetia bacterium]
MSTMVGSAPVYLNEATGDLIADVNAIGEMGEVDGMDDSGAVFSPRRMRRGQRRLARIDRRRARLAAKYGIAEETESDDSDAPILDLYQQATALGAVTENQYDGLGSDSLAAGGTGQLADILNRNVWAKGFVLDSDDPPSILVTAITIAGLPVNIGSEGAPLSLFASNSTRFGIQFGRRPILVGQRVVIDLLNIDSSGHIASGVLVCDELNPYMTQQLWERVLVQAAVDMYGR